MHLCDLLDGGYIWCFFSSMSVNTPLTLGYPKWITSVFCASLHSCCFFSFLINHTG